MPYRPHNSAGRMRSTLFGYIIAKRTNHKPSPVGEGGPRKWWMRCHTTVYILLLLLMKSLHLIRHGQAVTLDVCNANSTVLAPRSPTGEGFK